MAAQRRAAPRGPESGGAGAAGPDRGDRRRPGSAKRSGARQEPPRGWLKAAFLLASAVLGGLLGWSHLGAEEGVTEVLARHKEHLQGRFTEVPCSADYDSHKRYEGCTPRKCGRGVTDAVITREEAERIRRIAERGLSLGGSDGGASILDLHSGALSLGKHFVNLYRYFGDKIQDIFTEEDFALYRDVRHRIQQRIAQAFGINPSSLYLTKPTFFSRINNTEAKTTHDEYWHPHVDKRRFWRWTVCVYGCRLQQDYRAPSRPGFLFHLWIGEPSSGGKGSLGHSLCHHHLLHLQPRPRHWGSSSDVTLPGMEREVEWNERSPAKEGEKRR